MPNGPVITICSSKPQRQCNSPLNRNSSPHNSIHSLNRWSEFIAQVQKSLVRYLKVVKPAWGVNVPPTISSHQQVLLSLTHKDRVVKCRLTATSELNRNANTRRCCACLCQKICRLCFLACCLFTTSSRRRFLVASNSLHMLAASILEHCAVC